MSDGSSGICLNVMIRLSASNAPSMPLGAVDLELEAALSAFQRCSWSKSPRVSLRCVSHDPYADSASAPRAGFCRPRSVIEREALGVLLQRGGRMGRGLPFLPCSWSGQSHITSIFQDRQLDQSLRARNRGGGSPARRVRAGGSLSRTGPSTHPALRDRTPVRLQAGFDEGLPEVFQVPRRVSLA